MSNGYIQVTLGGKLRGLKFGMLAIEGIVKDGLRVKEKSEVSFTQNVYNLVYNGLLNNCEAKRIDPDFTYEEVMDWVDEMSATEQGKLDIEAISTTFVESRALAIMNEKATQITESAKKKDANETATS